MSTKSKFSNRRCEVDGIPFASKMEAEYYLYLKDLETTGAIKSIVLQPKFLLQPVYKKHGKTVRAIHYVADFGVVYADGRRVVIDVKGAPTAVFKLKQKLYGYLYDEPLVCVTKTRHGWREWI